MDDLNTLLEERVADVPVGAPPIDAMRAAVRRRRSRLAVLGAAAAVALVTSGVVAVELIDTTPDGKPPVAGVLADPDAPPEGYRYVGIGTAVIAVPKAWGTNETQCGTPVEDTVVIDVGVVCTALFPRHDGVESVDVRPFYQDADTFKSWPVVEIDGEAAYRSPVGIESGVASGSIYVPAYDATFIATSSSAGAVAQVEQILDGVAILEDHVTVPGFQFAFLDKDAYLAELEGAGLTVEVVTEQSAFDKGTVLATDPAVGSVVAPGDTVTVTVAR